MTHRSRLPLTGSAPWRASLLAPGLALLVGCSARTGSAPATEAPTSEPQAVVQTVRWPGGTLDSLSLGALSTASREAVGRSPVPVLVPRGAPLATGKLMVGPHWYAFSADLGGAHVSVSATRVAYTYGVAFDVPARREVRGLAVSLTRSEGIWSASWLEHNVAYSLDLECAAVGDARCADERSVLELIRGLVYVGGEGAR